MRLYDDHCTLEPEGVCHKRVNQLRRRDYGVAVEEMHAVPSSSKECAYPVWEVSTLPAPLDSDVEIDAVADRMTVWVCGCDDFWYRGSSDDGDMAEPSEWATCKHALAVSRELKAEQDEQQVTL